MRLPGFLLGAAALCLAAPAICAQTHPAKRIHVACPTLNAATVCAALADELGQMQSGGVDVIDRPAAPGVAALTIHYTPHLMTDASVAGHLIWIDQDGSVGEGPRLELSVMDAPLTDGSLAQFAARLILFSDLPI